MFLNISLQITAAILFSFIIHLIIHEMGHLVGGLLTGWQFIYLQIFKLALVKGKKCISAKSVNQINFQCIMSPQNISANPYLYTLGGCIFNVILSVISLTVMITNNSTFTLIYSWSFFVMGIGFLITNGIPRVKQICNDMACFLLLRKDSLTRKCHNAQLMVAKLLYEGYTYKQIDKELLGLPGKEAYNDILAYQAVLEYYYYLDIGDSQGQKRALEKINNERVLSECIKGYVQIEQVYFSLITLIKKHRYLSEKNNHGRLGSASDFDMTQLDEPEGQHLKNLQGDVHMERVKAACNVYKELKNKNYEKAGKYIIKSIDNIEHIGCIYSGERNFCIRQLRLLDECVRVCQGDGGSNTFSCVGGTGEVTCFRLSRE